MTSDSTSDSAHPADPTAAGARQYCNGLVLWASRPVPGLTDAAPGAPVDLELWLNDEPPWSRDREVTGSVHVSPHHLQGRPTMEVLELDGGAWFRMSFFDDIDFEIDAGGTRVHAFWAAHQTLADAATYLLGPVIGFVLRRRGVTGLHASSVAIDGRAVALVGPAGAGKSTTAAAFAHAGFPILGDDFVPLSEEDGRIMARPAYPIIRLWTESARHLYGSPEALPTIAPSWDKRYVDLLDRGHTFVTEAMELGAIYLFRGRRDHPRAPYAEPTSHASALRSLVASTNATFLMDPTMRGEEFRFLTRVIRRIPIRALHPHVSMDRLSELPGTIVTDFRAIRGNGA